MQKWGPHHGPCPKQKTIFFSEIIKPDPKLSKPFYFNKIPYVLAELCFSILCNAFLLKSAISSHNSCEDSIRLGRGRGGGAKGAMPMAE